MRKLALAIQTCPSGNDALARHWTYFKNASADRVAVITTTDGRCRVPENATEEMIGADIYCVGKHLCLRLLRTLQYLRESDCGWFCVAEYDIVFFKPIPRNLPEGMTAHFAGTKPQGCHCNQFFHGPWIMDRDTADEVVKVGYEILALNVYDPSPDCFLGQIVEKAKISTHIDILKSYSRNTIHENHPWIQEARAAAANGAVCIHGVKSALALQQITQ